MIILMTMKYYGNQKLTIKIKRFKSLTLEILKTKNSLNPEFMKNYFQLISQMLIRSNDILVKDLKTVTFGNKIFSPKIWNALPQNRKAENSYHKFQEYLATWFVNL